MKVIPHILKDLPLQQAKHQAGEMTNKEFEEYLLEVIEYLAELSDLNIETYGADYIKDYLWATLEFTI